MLARCGNYLPQKKLSTAKNHQLISFWQIQVIWFGGFLTVWILDHYSGEGVYNHIWHLFPRQTDKNQPQSILAYHKWPSSSRILFSNAVKILRQSKKYAITDKCFLMSKKKKYSECAVYYSLVTKKRRKFKRVNHFSVDNVASLADVLWCSAHVHYIRYNAEFNLA